MMSDRKIKDLDKVINRMAKLLMTNLTGRDLALSKAYRKQAQSKIAQQKAQEAFRQARDALPEYREYQRTLETYRQDRNRYETAKANIDKEVRESRASDIIDREFAEVNE